jgi:DNA invertase Pin-like site-specific DNA recombinase
MNFVAYYRVSRERQERSGLGLDAQRARVAAYVATQGGALVGEFTETESGKRVTRPELERAIAMAKGAGATLIVGKLDRMARNTRYLLMIIDSGIAITFCDLPTIPDGAMGRFIITQMAAIAELEAGLISERTKAALAIARQRGKRLGANGIHLARRRRHEARDRARFVYERVLGLGVDLRTMTIAEAMSVLNNHQVGERAWKRTVTQRLLQRIRLLD